MQGKSIYKHFDAFLALVVFVFCFCIVKSR